MQQKRTSTASTGNAIIIKRAWNEHWNSDRKMEFIYVFVLYKSKKLFLSRDKKNDIWAKPNSLALNITDSVAQEIKVL